MGAQTCNTLAQTEHGADYYDHAIENATTYVELVGLFFIAVALYSLAKRLGLVDDARAQKDSPQ